jgi:Tfp pilus assembly protein PilO
MSVVFICAALLLSFTYTKPTYNATTGSQDNKQKSIVELKDEVVRYEEALEKTREIERVRDGLQAKYDALTPEQMERLNKFLPDGIDSVRLIVDLDNAARTHGLIMHDIVVADSKERSSNPDSPDNSALGLYSFVNLSFNVTGTYDNLAAFLKDIETSLRVMDVSRASILAGPVKDDGSKLLPTYLLNLVLKAYYLN